MRIKDYVNRILSSLATSSYITTQSLSFEERPPDAAYIKGVFTFIDGSRLYFKEFMIFESESVNVLKYGYNYVAKDDTLIFRYDNAFDPDAKKLFTYPEHKHIPDELLPIKKPAFDEILREIAKLVKLEFKK